MARWFRLAADLFILYEFLLKLERRFFYGFRADLSPTQDVYLIRVEGR